jgi:hypothetical protein
MVLARTGSDTLALAAVQAPTTGALGGGPARGAAPADPRRARRRRAVELATSPFTVGRTVRVGHRRGRLSSRCHRCNQAIWRARVDPELRAASSLSRRRPHVDVPLG